MIQVPKFGMHVLLGVYNYGLATKGPLAKTKATEPNL
jgi:hypothetical protein